MLGTSEELRETTSRRRILRSSGIIATMVISLSISGCSSDGEEDRAFVYIQNHDQEENVFSVEIKNDEDKDADATIILKLLDESETILARLEREETIGAGSTRRLEFEVEEEDIDGGLKEVHSYEFELDGELVE